ncbi:Gmk, Guanylate kinase [Lactobacillus selangorensis]|uniref:Gmk, Guanylate kinase n=1 Tax=Lactobacillus selangorensis TaxID=81857 RepID=A0A0R2FR10_9LACO|nr:guanylate kinase [Lactobacillus selangorensis]KRN28181.1 Gmk, Guanylate kinase [Lactobacillus selangorensis]KRN30943.1 Gmk, Guanylate kinase [Lactobacillus selangorensis]
MAGHQLIIITGAAGTGKTSVSQYLRAHYGIPRVITHTTRPKRPHEQDGAAYYFETPASFKTKHYIEHVTYSNYQYGSSHEALDLAWQKSNLVSIVLDTKGAETYLQTLNPNEILLLFLTVHEPQLLRKRMLQRGDAQQMVAERLASPEYRRDLALPAPLKPYAHVIVNDDRTTARQQIDAIVVQAQKKLQ